MSQTIDRAVTLRCGFCGTLNKVDLTRDVHFSEQKDRYRDWFEYLNVDNAERIRSAPRSSTTTAPEVASQKGPRLCSICRRAASRIGSEP